MFPLKSKPAALCLLLGVCFAAGCADDPQSRQMLNPVKKAYASVECKDEFVGGFYGGTGEVLNGHAVLLILTAAADNGNRYLAFYVAGDTVVPVNKLAKRCSPSTLPVPPEISVQAIASAVRDDLPEDVQVEDILRQEAQ